MDKNHLVVFVRKGLPFVVRGIGFVALMMFSSMISVLNGAWRQSDTLANTWRMNLRYDRPDERFNDLYYWSARIAAMCMECVCLIVLAHIVVWITGLVF